MTEQLDVRPASDRPDVGRPAAPPNAPTPSAPTPTAPTPAAPAPGAPPKRRRRLGPLIGLVVVIGLGFGAWRLLGAHKAAAPAGRPGAGAPQSVGVATIGTGDIDVVLSGLGAVTPLATVTVKTQINGVLQFLGFTEGQLVHRGQFLAQIDPRPYQVALEQAQGTLAHDQALLAQAQRDSDRYQVLKRQDSISRQQADDQVFLIKQYQASIVTDQGTIDADRLNLVYCHIVSPVDGRVGIRLVDPGNYVQTSDAGLFVVVELHPISVLFTLPEDDIDALQTQMAAGPLTVTAYNRADTALISTGRLATTDNEIDATTGTVRLRAMFDNLDNRLFPQEFVNAHLLVQTLHGVTVAPQAAVQHGAPGDFVYLVHRDNNGADNTVAIQTVKLGPVQADRVQILSGLKPGDVVVTDGLDRLRNGAKITVAKPAGATPAHGEANAGKPAEANGAQPAAKPAGAAPTP